MGDPDEYGTPVNAPNDNLPNWLTWSIVGALTVLFIINVGLDYHSTTYDGQGESIIIAGLIGASLGFDKIRRDR